jgi:hypothetical protein
VTAPADLTEFAWIWNRRAKLGTPTLHRRVLRWLNDAIEQRDHRLLLMAFRGAGKSTLIGLFCAWRLYRDPDTRFLVLAADHALATRMVTTVRRILQRHPLCAELLPDRADGSWAADRFTVARDAVLRDPSMLAAGIGGNITGARADIIVCDDIEVPGNSDTPHKREELRERLVETEFVLVPGGTILFVGTPHTEESLYAEGENAFLAGYRRLVIPVLDANGESAWPQRFTPEHIAKLRNRSGPIGFSRQMMLESVPEEAARFDPALMARYAEEPAFREANGRAVMTLMGNRLVSGGAFWDPSFGRADRGDASAVAATFADGDGRYYLHRVAYITHDPKRADSAHEQCRTVATIARDLLLPVVWVEINGVGKFLPQILRQELARIGHGCAVVEVSNTKPKAQRILGALDSVLGMHRLSAHESVFRTSFPREMAAWRAEAAGNRDDALDALAGCIMAEPVRLPQLPPRPVGMSWR